MLQNKSKKAWQKTFEGCYNMGEIITNRSFVPINNVNERGEHIFQLCGGGVPPILFIDEVEGLIYKRFMSTPYNDFYIKEKFDNGI